MTEPQCSRDGCDTRVTCNGMCSHHYWVALRIGQTGLVPAQPVIEHLQALRELGWDWDSISAAGAVPRSTIRKMPRLNPLKTRMATAVAVMSIPLTPGTGGIRADTTVAARQVHALMRIGWRIEDIAPAADVSQSALVSILKRPTCSFYTVRGIDKAYAKLSHRRGPATAAAVSRAANSGYFPPAAWDDITDLNETPTIVEDTGGVDEVLVARFLTDRADLAELNNAEQVEAVRRLTRAGWSQNQISLKVHWGAERTRREMAA